MTNKRVVFRTEWFDVEEEHFDRLTGLEGKPYYRIRTPDGVLVLALTEAKQIILVRQFRPAIGAFTLELPSGAIEEGESPVAAAERELFEETGYRCHTLKSLGSGRIMVSRTNSREFVFLGTDARRDPTFQRKDGIDVVLVRPGEFRALVRSGEFEQLAALALLVLAEWTLGVRVAWT